MIGYSRNCGSRSSAGVAVEIVSTACAEPPRPASTLRVQVDTLSGVEHVRSSSSAPAWELDPSSGSGPSWGVPRSSGGSARSSPMPQGEAPALRHQHEFTRLRPAAAVPSYDIRPVEIRKVAPDCHFSFEGTRYSVPPAAGGHTVTVRPSGDRAGNGFAVYLGEALLAEHRQTEPDTTPAPSDFLVSPPTDGSPDGRR